MAEVQDFEELGEFETVEEQIKEVPEEPELPEKYKGKSVSDVVRMHQEAEKLIDRQAQEVGETRRLADELIKSQLHKKSEVEKPQEVDFFENPQEAIRQAVDNNPKVLAAEQYAQQVHREQAKAKMAQLHPDFGQVIQDKEFIDWVSSSKIRSQLLRQADAYDVDAADELFSTFKSLKAVKQNQVSEVDKKTRTDALNSAAVETGGSGESSKKVYRRADLINLKLRDPRKFEAMQEEIDRAYQEGRVK